MKNPEHPDHEFETCGFCRGIGKNMPKAEYDQLEGRLKEKTRQQIGDGGKPIPVMQLLAQMLKDRPDCAFCDGGGLVSKPISRKLPA